LVEEESGDEGAEGTDELGALKPSVVIAGAALAVAAAAAGWVAASGSSSDPPPTPTPSDDPRIVLQSPARPVVHALDRAGCEGWVEEAEVVRCEAGEGHDLAWLVARTGDRWQAQVFRRVDDRRFALALVAGDEASAGAPPAWREIGVAAADLDGDGEQEIVFGFHLVGSGGILVTELVDDGVVVAHGELDQGAVRLSEQGLQTWSARYGPDDPGCCPSSFDRVVLARAGDAWVEVESGVVAPDSVPESAV
jgi:hypothetical protein